MKECKRVANLPFNFNNRRGFTWLRPLQPLELQSAPQPEPEPKEEPGPNLVYQYEDMVTTCEEYLAYKVVDAAVQYLLPGNYYKIGEFIYSWDNRWQQWVCIDQIAIPEAEAQERDLAQLIEELF